MNKLFTEIGGKVEFSAQGEDLASFVGQGTKVKIPSEIKPPLLQTSLISLMSLKQIPTANIMPNPTHVPGFLQKSVPTTHCSKMNSNFPLNSFTKYRTQEAGALKNRRPEQNIAGLEPLYIFH